MNHNGFEHLRNEGRKDMYTRLEKYLQHEWECIMNKAMLAARKSKETGEPRQDANQFECICGLDEVKAEVAT